MMMKMKERSAGTTKGALLWALVACCLIIQVHGVQIETADSVKTVAGGSSVALECRVADLGSGTVVWTYVDHNITIAQNNKIMVTARGGPSTKYEIFRPQDTGTEFWNLAITNIELSDQGSYKCYIQGMETTVNVIHQVKVTDAPTVTDIPKADVTDCCIQSGVEQCALPLCNTNTSITDMIAVLSDDACVEKNLVKVLICGQGGRNHLGCCMRRGVSQLCQTLCDSRGEDTTTDFSSCIGTQSISIALCLEEGQALIPSQPAYVTAISLGNSLMVIWKAPLENADLVTGYRLQYRPKTGPGSDHFTSTEVLSFSNTNYQITNLDYNRIYELRVIAAAEFRASQPSYTVDIATADRSVVNNLSNTTVQDCCKKQNVSSTCEPYCEANSYRFIGHPDTVVSCFGELDTMYQCLAGQGNHTPCCQRVQVPEICYPLCEGNFMVSWEVSSCIVHLPLISGCMIEGSLFLPLSPKNTHLVPGSVTSTSATVTWTPPDNMQESSYYVVAYRKSNSPYLTWNTFDVMSGTQFTVTGLRPATAYDLTVATVNNKGSSLPELTIVFVTEGETNVVPQAFNETACCIEKGVPGKCLNICSHEFRLTDEVLTLGIECPSHLLSMLYCASDSRDHTACCKKSVPKECQTLCKLDGETVPSYNVLSCISYKDQLSTCFNDGKAILPRPPVDVELKTVDITWVLLSWSAPSGPNVTGYIVQYTTDTKTWEKAPQTSETFLKIENLKPDTVYYLRVYAINNKGWSLSSPMVAGYTLPSPVSNITDKPDWPQVWHNRSECCKKQGILAECQASCENITLLDPEKCGKDLDIVIACAADGRDHSSCCKKFPEFPEVCLDFCRGQKPDRNILSALCISYMVPIFTCFTEGKGLLPSPPQDVRVTTYTESEISLAWNPPLENCGVGCSYIVLSWQEDDEVFRNNTGKTQYTFSNLKFDSTYRVSVQATNSYGGSLPAPYSIVTTKTNPFMSVSVTQYPIGVVNSETASVQLECVTRGDPIAISWTRNNKVVSSDNTYVISNIAKSKEGNYTCVAHYTDDTKKMATLFLNVRYKPVPQHMYEDHVLPGTNQDAYITCMFSGFPNTVSWSKDITPLQTSDKFYIPALKTDLNNGTTIATLRVRSVTREDYGTYRCTAENQFGTKEITGKLAERPLPTPTPIGPVSNVSDCCRARGVNSLCIPKICTYTIDLNAVIYDTSLYTCLAHLEDFFACGADGRDHTSCCIQQGIDEYCMPLCAGKLPTFDNPLQLMTCYEHATTISDCIIQGTQYIPSPPRNVHAGLNFDTVRITWDTPKKNPDKVKVYDVHYKKKGSTISDEAAPTISKSKSLTDADLQNVEKGASYLIWVTAANDFGKSSKSDITEISVTSLLPKEPQGVQVNLVAGTMIRVSWNRPLSVINILYYTVQFREDTAIGILVTTQPVYGSQTRLENLKPNTMYEISVAAWSEDGAGKMSDKKYIKTGEERSGAIEPQDQSQSNDGRVGLAVGLVLGFVFLAVIIVIVVLAYRFVRRKNTNPPTIEFENPSFGRGAKITGLPGESTSDSNQFEYGHLNEEQDVDNSYVDPPDSTAPATLDVSNPGYGVIE